MKIIRFNRLWILSTRILEWKIKEDIHLVDDDVEDDVAAAYEDEENEDHAEAFVQAENYQEVVGNDADAAAYEDDAEAVDEAHQVPSYKARQVHQVPDLVDRHWWEGAVVAAAVAGVEVRPQPSYYHRAAVDWAWTIVALLTDSVLRCFLRRHCHHLIGDLDDVVGVVVVAVASSVVGFRRGVVISCRRVECAVGLERLMALVVVAAVVEDDKDLLVVVVVVVVAWLLR
jgi:hypothetical protein